MIVRELRCTVEEIVDAEFPGWVRATLVDAPGHRWTFVDKEPIFLAAHPPSLPADGVIRCEILEASSSDEDDDVITIKTVDVIAEEDERAVFRIRRDQLLPGKDVR